jgi:predicted phosphodiesterase
MKTSKKCVVLSDVHFPFEDKVAVQMAIDYIKKAKPDTVILNGDIMDCFTEDIIVKVVSVARGETNAD